MSGFKVKLVNRNVTKEQIIEDLNRIATEKEVNTITSKEYLEIGSFGVNTILRKFGSWNEALLSAGLTAPNRQHISDTELFENIANVWSILGRQPFGRELEKSTGNSKFALGTYEKRFKTWNNALIEFEKFINGNSDEIGYENSTESTTSTEILLTKRKTPRKINWRLRAKILIRDNCICQMCGASPAKNPDVVLHVDHIKPYSKGGETVQENLRTLCSICNIGKSDMHDDE
ncbi:homing endonuclease associated repeat-containing protein [Ralstonia pseudosolanacearum]|uniref:homing endonuclease associated repeat-containing protein n=2 Tax=Ralstonia pseudosolanacearum TaxID=1310165 RepID=UPI0018677BEA|nr:HNH endonuclease [Ralstonia pseudosolanacearum]UWD90211.1 HNH endonuclease [Ralstonia pseudosolanacearum]CAH0441865.1 hypothetical protein LMG9673_02675 [Ralstonia pseudosolanacearum]